MTDQTISSIRAREVLDCRGLPTVQVDVRVEGDRVLGRADVPSGRSTGSSEAHEMRDGGARFGGFGVQRAVANVNDILSPALIGWSVASQRELDAKLVALDGTDDKSALGANALLGISLAAARASAAAGGRPLYRHLSADAHLLPVPLVNLINGGRHASNDLDFQEFIILPVGATSLLESLQISTEVNLVLAGILAAKFGKVALNTGDEGGFAPPISSPEQALELLHEAVDKSGWAHSISYGLDCAATHWYDPQTDLYTLDGRQLDRDELIARYLRLIEDFNLVTIEDPLQEEDFEGFAQLTAASGIQIVGDDLFTTNPSRLARGIKHGSANSLLWKVNQIGTLSEAWDAATMAFHNGLSVVVSERSGETEDPIIADLVVALGAGQIKTGAPVRGERTAKYNRMLQIEEELGSSARYAGRVFGGASV